MAKGMRGSLTGGQIWLYAAAAAAAAASWLPWTMID